MYIKLAQFGGMESNKNEEFKNGSSCVCEFTGKNTFLWNGTCNIPVYLLKLKNKKIFLD